MADDFYHEVDARIYIKASVDYQSLFLKAELGEYESFKLAHEAVRTLFASFKGTAITGPLYRVLLRSENEDIEALILSGTARIRHIETGIVYNLTLEFFKPNDSYENLHSAVTTKFNDCLTYAPAQFAFDIIEVSTRPNPNYVPS